MKAAVITEHGELDKIKLSEAAKLKPVIDSVFPLGKIRDATLRMEQGNQFGKIVLKISE